MGPGIVPCGRVTVPCAGNVDTDECDISAYRDPLEKPPCDEDGCCQWKSGFGLPWFTRADAFRQAVHALYEDADTKSSLEAAIATIPREADSLTGSYLSTTIDRIYRTVYAIVALKGNATAREEILKMHPQLSC